jgi:hypothetical protein
MSNTIALELSLRLEGKREDVVADVAVFLEAFEKMMTASASALPSVLGVAGPEDWPEYNNRLVRYKGKEVTVTKVYDLVFQQLWEARGSGRFDDSAHSLLRRLCRSEAEGGRDHPPTSESAAGAPGDRDRDSR